MSLLLTLISLSFAEQVKHDVDKSSTTWSFDVTWRDAESRKHRIEFELPASEVKADLAEPLRLQAKAFHQDVAADVNAWGKTKKAKVKAKGTKKGVSISVKGDNARSVLKDATQEMEASQKRRLRERGFTLLDGAIVPDHMRHVRQYADDLGPMVDAIGRTRGERDFAERALSYVQSIPYEKASLKRDRYRRPLSLVGRNRGDCDSKATLFLALMHEAYPDMDMGIVYIKGHAYAAIAIEKQAGDDTRRHDGVQYVLVEPVGPAMHPVGEISRKSKRKSRFGRAEIVAL